MTTAFDVNDVVFGIGDNVYFIGPGNYRPTIKIGCVKSIGPKTCVIYSDGNIHTVFFDQIIKI